LSESLNAHTSGYGSVYKQPDGGKRIPASAKDIPESPAGECAAISFARWPAATLIWDALGDTLTNRKTTLAADGYRGARGAGRRLVPIRESGSMLPQLFIAAYIANYPTAQKRLDSRVSLVQAAALTGMGVAAWLTSGLAGRAIDPRLSWWYQPRARTARFAQQGM